MKKAIPFGPGLLISGAFAALLFALAGVSFVGCWETDVKGTAGSPCKADAGCRADMVCKACGCMPEGVECPTDANDEGGGDAADAPSESAPDAPIDAPAETAADTAPDTTDAAVPADATDAVTDG